MPQRTAATNTVVNDVGTSEYFNELSAHKLQKCPLTVVTVSCVNAYALQRV